MNNVFWLGGNALEFIMHSTDEASEKFIAPCLLFVVQFDSYQIPSDYQKEHSLTHKESFSLKPPYL